MSYDTPVDWQALLKDAEWTVFEHEGLKYRATRYKLDGGEFVAIHKFVGTNKCPPTQGWAGYQWCVHNNEASNWPSKEVAEAVLPKVNEVSVGTKSAEQPAESVQPVQQPRFIPSQTRDVGGIPLPPPGEKRY